MIENAILREWFAGAVGQQIFCRFTEKVLDCRRAVEVSIFDADNDTLIANIITTAAFYDRAIKDNLTAIVDDVHRHAPDTRVRFEITDGRRLYAEDDYTPEKSP